MHTQNRPNRSDWIAGLAAGAALGLVYLGVGSRAGMRLVALSADLPLFLVHGVLLHTFWCRIYLARMRPVA